MHLFNECCYVVGIVMTEWENEEISFVGDSEGSVTVELTYNKHGYSEQGGT